MIYRRTGGEWTEYRPPKRALFGHQARKRDPIIAWQVTKEFLRVHCLYRLSSSPIKLTCWDPGPWTSRAASTAGFERVTAQFGEPDERKTGVKEWVLAPSQLEDAIECCVSSNRSWPKEETGPLTIHFSYVVVWRSLTEVKSIDPESLGVHGHPSHLSVGVWTRALFIQPYLLFPFAWDSPDLARFLSEIEPACPFRFRDQYFYRLLPSKSGEFTRARKLPKGSRKGL